MKKIDKSVNTIWKINFLIKLKKILSIIISLQILIFFSIFYTALGCAVYNIKDQIYEMWICMRKKSLKYKKICKKYIKKYSKIFFKKETKCFGTYILPMP